jgi:hypothetical protein
MKRRSWWRAGAVLALAFFGVSGTGLASPETESAVSWAHDWMKSRYQLQQGWPLSPGLREAGEAMARQHLERIRPVLHRWVHDEYARITADATIAANSRAGPLRAALYLRMQNEQALALMDAASPEHDAWRLRVVSQPGVCRYFWNAHFWGEALLWIERLPESERAAALAHERTLLERWGATRPAVPGRPAFDLDAYGQVLVDRLRADPPGARPPHAMVPAVAQKLLVEEPRPLAGSEAKAPPARNFRCAALQWALANAREERAAEPAVLWSAFRHALIERAEDAAGYRWRQSNDWVPAKIEDGEYPRVAQRLEVTGTVRVEVRFDAAGKVVAAKVVGRKLGAPGLSGVRPLFVETTLDEGSLMRARGLKNEGAGTRIVEFVWKLS